MTRKRILSLAAGTALAFGSAMFVAPSVAAQPEPPANILLDETPTDQAVWETVLTVEVSFGELGEESLPVEVVTSFQRPEVDFPEGTMIRILRDGAEVGEVEIPETGDSVTFEEDIPRASQTQTHRYTSEIVEISDDEGDTWSGSTAAPAVVIVTGTNGATEEPTTGSLHAGSVTGSVEGSLSDSVGYDVAPLSALMPEMSAMLSSGS